MGNREKEWAANGVVRQKAKSLGLDRKMSVRNATVFLCVYYETFGFETNCFFLVTLNIKIVKSDQISPYCATNANIIKHLDR